MRQQWQWTGQQQMFFEQRRMPPMVKGIIIATAAAYLVQVFLAKGVLEYYFALWPSTAVWKLNLWQFFTYLFLHDPRGIFHILFNMLCLYFFGREIEVMLGKWKFLGLYLTAGAVAGVAHCLMGLFMPAGAFMIGASGAVMAVMVIYAICFPNQMILFFFFVPMKIRTCILILIGIDLFYGAQGSPTGVANFAHLGGALFGLLYWKGRPWIDALLGKVKERLASRRRSVDLHEEEDLDRILEKISQHGMDSLTKRERSYLLRASERRRRQKVSHEGHA